MRSLRKFAPTMSWRIVAAVACVTLAAGPGLAAGRHAPHHASQPPAQGAGQAGSTSAGQAKPEGGNATGPIDTTAAKTTPKEPADHGKTTDSKSVGPIDLTRPDDGYGNLRRRAARTSLIAAQKKPAVVAPAAATAHPPAATAEHTRNAAGAAVPAAPALPAAVGAARPEPVHAESVPGFGGAKNNLGLSTTGVHPAPGSCRDDAGGAQAAGRRDQRHEPAPGRSRYRGTGDGPLGNRRLAHTGISDTKPQLTYRHESTAGHADTVGGRCDRAARAPQGSINRTVAALMAASTRVAAPSLTLALSM